MCADAVIELEVLDKHFINPVESKLRVYMGFI